MVQTRGFTVGECLKSERDFAVDSACSETDDARDSVTSRPRSKLTATEKHVTFC